MKKKIHADISAVAAGVRDIMPNKSELVCLFVPRNTYVTSFELIVQPTGALAEIASPSAQPGVC